MEATTTKKLEVTKRSLKFSCGLPYPHLTHNISIQQIEFYLLSTCLCKTHYYYNSKIIKKRKCCTPVFSVEGLFFQNSSCAQSFYVTDVP